MKVLGKLCSEDIVFFSIIKINIKNRKLLRIRKKNTVFEFKELCRALHD